MPLLWTVYALLSFRNFHALPAGDESASDEFYQAPPGYRHKALHESLSKDKKKHESGGGRPIMEDAFGDLEEEDFLF